MKQLVFLLLAAIGLTGRPVAAQPAPPQVLSVSDIHFTPVLGYGLKPGNALLAKLMAKGVTVDKWPAILMGPGADYEAPTKGDDTNYWLLRTTLDNMAATCSQPDVIIITGDFLGHNLTTKAFPAGTADTDSLLIRLNEFLAYELNQRFSKAIVLPGLGNNDTNTTNYHWPSETFRKRFAQVWVPLQRRPSKALDREFVEDFIKHGYYDFPLPGAGGARVLMLNTVPFSPKGNLGNYPTHYASDELTWLKGRLSLPGPVWLAMHIPPGMSPFGKNLMWNYSENQEYLSIIGQYAATIKAQWAGHTHLDEFRLRYPPAGAAPDAFVRVTASVSPYYDNNPSFQVVDYNPATLAIEDIHVHYLTLLDKVHVWGPEYAFNKAYNVKGIKPGTLQTVQSQVTNDAYYRGLYRKYYGASSKIVTDNVSNKYKWPYYLCTISSMTAPEYSNCLVKNPPKLLATPPQPATRRKGQPVPGRVTQAASR